MFMKIKQRGEQNNLVNIEIRESKKVFNNVNDKSLFLSFPYNEKYLEIMHSYLNRFWHNNTKEWELQYTKLDELISKIGEQNVNIIGERYIAPTTEIDYQFKTKPFKHQIEGFNFGISHNKWLLGDEQGLGKTKTSIDIAVARKNNEGLKHCLIICGVNGLKWNWQREISIHSNESGWILGQRLKNGKWQVNGNADKLKDLKEIDKIKDYFIITNVETMRSAEVVSELVKLCKEDVISMCIADEIHQMKSSSSLQGRGFLKLNPKYKIAMTGTPLMNTPLDLYVPLKWLGCESHSFYLFKQRYCVMGGFGGYQITGYRNLSELQSTLNEIMLRRLKSDVLDLPDKLYVDEFVEMTPKQNEIYKEILMDLRFNIDKIKQSLNPLAELIRLRQATGYTGILSSSVSESAKLTRMTELVQEALSNNKKVVIFSNWTQITNAVDEYLSNTKDEYNVPLSTYSTYITGETKDSERQERVNAFQTKDNIKIIVGTIGAMGTGVTLTAGTVVIFLDEPWTMANKQQAIDRCHRIGTKENITIYTLQCKNTIDEKIHNIVENKGIMSDILVDGKRTDDLRAVVEYLLN